MRFIKIFLFFIFTFFIFSIDTFALEGGLTRSRENLLVPDDVLVDGNNLEDIFNTPAVSSSEKIYDYAELFNDNEKEKLLKKIKQFVKDSKMDAVIVTTKELNGFTLEEFTYNFYDYNDFLNDGVIFVIYMNNKEPEIYMGNSGDHSGKVFKIYTDERINQTLAYVYKDISVGNYFKATNDYIEILDGFYRIDSGGNYEVSEEGKIVKKIPWIEITVLSFALTFICVFIFLYRIGNRCRKAKLFDKNIDLNTLMIRTDRDEGISNL